MGNCFRSPGPRTIRRVRVGFATVQIRTRGSSSDSAKRRSGVPRITYPVDRSREHRQRRALPWTDTSALNWENSNETTLPTEQHRRRLRPSYSFRENICHPNPSVERTSFVSGRLLFLRKNGSGQPLEVSIVLQNRGLSLLQLLLSRYVRVDDQSIC